jgi:polysaccharide biosynthesis/export protein ExoF
MATRFFSLLSSPTDARSCSAEAIGFHFFPAVLALWCGLIAFDQFIGIGRSDANASSGDSNELRVSSVSTGVENFTPSATASFEPSEFNKLRPVKVAAIDMPEPSALKLQRPISSSAHQLNLSIGDQLKITVYERLEIDEDKWGNAKTRTRAPSASLQMRAELTGDYTVQEDGMIAMPLLGAFQANDRTLEDVQNDIASAFEATVGRQGIVNVRLTERLPIYVLGPVKNSGLYKFSAGMTAWHAVALAGGFEQIDRSANYLGNRLEATREIGNVQRSNGQLARLIARKEVLIAQREKRPAVVPSELEQISGREAAASVIAGEVSARSLLVAAQEARGTSARAALQAAKSELEAARERISLIELTIRQHGERLATLNKLGATGNLRRPQLLEAELQLSQVQERREEARISSSQAEHRISQAQQELARILSDSALELDTQISSVERELSETRGQRHVGLNLLEVLTTSDRAQSPAQSDIDQLVQYEIVRRSGDQTTTIAAKGDTELQPGDLVKLTLPRQSRAPP